MPSGVVRGYDARTGKLLWTWDPIPWASQQKARTGAANAWSTLAADEKRGLVFVPTARSPITTVAHAPAITAGPIR